MRLTLTFIATLILTATNLYAAEFERNPDRFPSIGLSLGVATMDGDTTFTSGGLSAKQDTEIAETDITFDARIPVSDSVTVFGALGLSSFEIQSDETTIIDGMDIDTSGYKIRIGARMYLN